jgi:pimeloyl-ACP methyl ester carboxylesterase
MIGAGTVLLVSTLLSMWAPDRTQAELLQRYGQDTQWVEVQQGVRIHYKETGSKEAPAILMLHGFGASLQTWDAWANSLSSNYRVIRPDLPGFGLTGARADQNYSEAADLAALIQLLDRLNVKKVAVVGHSMGGKMAWNLAAADTDRVTALVLMAPDGFPDSQDIGSKPYEVPAVMGAIQYFLPKYFVRKSIEPAFSNPNALSDSLVDRYDDMLRAPGVRRAILDRANQTIYTDPVSRLAAIKAPTLLLWGENDQMIPSDNAQRYRTHLKNASVVMLPKLGHVLQEEQPEQGLSVVIQFLKKLQSSMPE